MEKIYISALLDVYGSFLSSKQRLLMEQYYNDDLSLSEIAENEGITRQGVSDNLKRAEAKLRRWEKELGYCDSFLKLKALSAKARGGDKKAIDEICSIIDDL
ncbi:MAG: YlxM family DNA-binding protein [Acutalibacteraceae bacterium]|jgi:predicted DNA-binding protein YlxM (UPF0122 family)